MWYVGWSNATPNVRSIFHQTSTDGITWTAPSIAVNGPAINQRLVCPQMVWEPEKDRFMSVCTDEAAWVRVMVGDNTGTNWSANVGATGNPYLGATFPFTGWWHHDIQRITTNLYVASSGISMTTMGNLRFLTSVDCTNWTARVENWIPKDPFSWTHHENYGWYKPSLIPKSLNPLRFDVYVNSGDAVVAVDSTYWRIFLFKDVEVKEDNFIEAYHFAAPQFVNESDGAYSTPVSLPIYGASTNYVWGQDLTMTENVRKAVMLPASATAYRTNVTVIATFLVTNAMRQGSVAVRLGQLAPSIPRTSAWGSLDTQSWTRTATDTNIVSFTFTKNVYYTYSPLSIAIGNGPVAPTNNVWLIDAKVELR
jgi:hypothetical protein